jgi:hypothetical protein
MLFKKYRRKYKKLCNKVCQSFKKLDPVIEKDKEDKVKKITLKDFFLSFSESSKNKLKVKTDTGIEITLNHKDNISNVIVQFLRNYKFSELGVSNKSYYCSELIDLNSADPFEELIKLLDNFINLSDSELIKIKYQNSLEISESIKKKQIKENESIRRNIKNDRLLKSFIDESEFIKDYLYDLQDILGNYTIKYEKFFVNFTFDFFIDCNLPISGDGSNIIINEDYINILRLLKNFSISMKNFNLTINYIISTTKKSLILTVIKSFDHRDYNNIIVTEKDIMEYKNSTDTKIIVEQILIGMDILDRLHTFNI